jgi:small subunit ribosomal protein S20
MANLRSSKKAIRKIATLTARNKAEKSALKTWQKKLKAACDKKDAPAIKSTAKILMSKIDKAKKHGVWHANKVNRIKSRLTPHIFQQVPAPDQHASAAQA